MHHHRLGRGADDAEIGADHGEGGGHGGNRANDGRPHSPGHAGLEGDGGRGESGKNRQRGAQGADHAGDLVGDVAKGLAEPGEVEPVEGLEGRGVDGLAEEAGKELGDFLRGAGDGVGDKVEAVGVAVHHVGQAADAGACLADGAVEVFEEGLEASAGAAENLHGGGGGFGGIFDGGDSLADGAKLLLRGQVAEAGDAEAQGFEGAGVGGAPLPCLDDGPLHAIDHRSGFVGAESVVLKGALQHEHLAGGDAGGGGEVAEFAAQIEGAAHLVEHAGEARQRGPGGEEDAGDAGDGRLQVAHLRLHAGDAI